MKVLVVGQGGREHAIVRGLKMSPAVSEVHVSPGSAGMAKDALCHVLDYSSSDFLEFVRRQDLDLVIVGPEVPLAEGLADRLREMGVDVFGPNQAAAHLEGSKVFAKSFMERAGVPTARAWRVETVAEVMERARELKPPYVLKADGLAAGKGVTLSMDAEDLKSRATALFEDRVFGKAGASALLEEHLSGWEMSYLILTNGKEFSALPVAQDHKRLKDGDLGPNTGGMGVVAPLAIDSELREQIDRQVVEPTLAAIQADSQMDYRGVLYIGLMITTDGPKVIEYNVRFGDPEAQVIFPLLDGDWGEVLRAVAGGEVPSLSWREMNAACVVLAAEGYPEAPMKGVDIHGDVFQETASSYFLHAGTGYDEKNTWQTAGGRVLNAVGLGSSREEALKNAYAQASGVQWKGLQLRKDIGQKLSSKNG